MRRNQHPFPQKRIPAAMRRAAKICSVHIEFAYLAMDIGLAECTSICLGGEQIRRKWRARGDDFRTFLGQIASRGLSLFQRSHSLLATYSRILFQEFIQRFSALQIVKQGLERNARAAKDGFSAVDIRILNNHALRGGSHLTSPYRRSIISLRREESSEKCDRQHGSDSEPAQTKPTCATPRIVTGFIVCATWLSGTDWRVCNLLHEFNFKPGPLQPRVPAANRCLPLKACHPPNFFRPSRPWLPKKSSDEPSDSSIQSTVNQPYRQPNRSARDRV